MRKQVYNAREEHYVRKFLRKALQEGLFAFDAPPTDESEEAAPGSTKGKEAEDDAERSAELLRRRLLSLVVDDPARQPELLAACEALVERGVLLRAEGGEEGTEGGTEQAAGEELGVEGQGRRRAQPRVFVLHPDRVRYSRVCCRWVRVCWLTDPFSDPTH